MLSMQSSGAFAKHLFQHFPILTVSCMRLFLGAVLIGLVFKIWRVKFREIKWSTILSFAVALAGLNLMFYAAIARLPLGIAVSFEFIGPLGVALLNARQKTDFIWVGLAILGLILLFPFDQAAQPLDPVGIALALGAGACWALYIVSGQKPSGISSNHTVCLGMFIALLMLLPLSLYVGIPASAFEPGNLFYFTIFATLASALPFCLDLFALRQISALSFGTLMSLEPAFAAFSGFIFLGETLLWNQWLALGMIITASIGCTFTTQRQKHAVVQTG
ncbi:EamA family transporter [Acinetobacter thermotolerans]|uniref:EamA family transporter n=1 Tax=Acinetobacter thermotolerans TaxID=3151487 RepID=UPI00325B8736